MPWPVACLSGGPEALLLCVLDQALNQNASIQPREGLGFKYVQPGDVAAD